MSGRLTAVGLAALWISACSQPVMDSRVDSVDIPQSAIRDQGSVGFCWGYTTVALIESLLIPQGLFLDLSEEALTFQKIADGLKASFDQARGSADLLRVTIDATGWTRYPTGYSERPENRGMRDGLQIAQDVGVIPESAWSFKFTSADMRTRTFRAIQNRAYSWAQEMEQQGRSPASLSREEIITNVMIGADRFTSRPPTSFLWEGQVVEGKEFLREKLPVLLSEFVALAASSDVEAGAVIEATKRSLAAGVSVPIGFPMSVARIHGNVFMGRDVPVSQDRNTVVANFAADGGHMMLATDFVNLGGHEGRLAPEELNRELARPWQDLDYLKLKNSWGVGVRSTSWGLPIAESADGYYKVDREYILGASSVAGLDPRYIPLVVVLRRDFLR